VIGEITDRRNAAAPNTANNDAPSFEMDYCCRSIAFGARKLIVHSAKSNGVACRDVMGKFKKRQRNSGQTLEPPKIFYDSS
jgi:hypothetical protein